MVGRAGGLRRAKWRKENGKRWCNHCQNYFNDNDMHFYPRKEKTGTITYLCRKKLAEYSRIYRENNPKKVQAYIDKFNKSNVNKYKRLRQSSRSRGIELTISFEDFSRMIHKAKCIYCDSPVECTAGSGLDRMESSAGYTFENVVPCCKSCNTHKWNDWTYEEMKVAMKAILALREVKKP